VKVVSAGDLKDDSGSEGGAGGKEKAVPTPLTIEDIKRYQKAFANSSKLAVEAGFDGIELHGARESLHHHIANATLAADTT
jgi:2,4-dienoyl-CoA reductase-like NADH-dependent reductase (Old Yellow Enzyme family)